MILSLKIETPIGKVTACSTDEGICLLAFDDKEHLKSIHKLEKLFGTSVREGFNDHLIKLKDQLFGYFEGKLKKFTVPLVIPGTPFQVTVWKELLKIGYGSTRSYLEQSKALGKPGSVRAVANANSVNRVAIIIPCHRIIGSDGALTGYAGGLERKRWLIEHEKRYSGKICDLTLF